MEVKNFDRTSVDMLRRALNQHLEQIKQETGLSCKLGTMKFSPTSCRLTLEFLAEGDTDAEEADFRRNCSLVGLSPADFDRRFTVNGNVYKIRAVKPSRHKYPISAINPFTNRMYKFSKSQVKFV